MLKIFGSAQILILLVRLKEKDDLNSSKLSSRVVSEDLHPPKLSFYNPINGIFDRTMKNVALSWRVFLVSLLSWRQNWRSSTNCSPTLSPLFSFPLESFLGINLSTRYGSRSKNSDIGHQVTALTLQDPLAGAQAKFPNNCVLCKVSRSIRVPNLSWKIRSKPME